MTANHLAAALLTALDVKERMRAAAPWALVTETSAGGAFAAGFDRDSEDLLVVGDGGQTIYDGSSGARIYRNRSESGYDETALAARRLDRASCAPIPMAGDHGGGLRKTTGDGWSVDILQLRWPSAFSVLHPPRCSIYFLADAWKGLGKDARFHLVMKSAGLPVAFGFSWSGNSLLWLDRSDLFLWRRSAATGHDGGASSSNSVYPAPYGDDSGAVS